MAQPVFSYRLTEYDDVIEKFNSVCKVVHELADVIKYLETKIGELEKKKEPGTKVAKRCRYFNSGFCREGTSCLFQHHEQTCQEYLQSGKCLSYRSCLYRHPKECRYWKGNKCYRGENCVFLHKEVLFEEVQVISVVNSNATMKVVTNGVDKEKIDVSKTNEPSNEMVDHMTVEDIMKFYEDDSYDLCKELGIHVDKELIDKHVSEENDPRYQTHVGPASPSPQVPDRRARRPARSNDVDDQICEVPAVPQTVPKDVRAVSASESLKKCEHSNWQEYRVHPW